MTNFSVKMVSLSNEDTAGLPQQYKGLYNMVHQVSMPTLYSFTCMYVILHVAQPLFKTVISYFHLHIHRECTWQLMILIPNFYMTISFK